MKDSRNQKDWCTFKLSVDVIAIADKKSELRWQLEFSEKLWRQKYKCINYFSYMLSSYMAVCQLPCLSISQMIFEVEEDRNILLAWLHKLIYPLWIESFKNEGFTLEII